MFNINDLSIHILTPPTIRLDLLVDDFYRGKDGDNNNNNNDNGRNKIIKREEDLLTLKYLLFTFETHVIVAAIGL